MADGLFGAVAGNGLEGRVDGNDVDVLIDHQHAFFHVVEYRAGQPERLHVLDPYGDVADEAIDLVVAGSIEIGADFHRQDASVLAAVACFEAVAADTDDVLEVLLDGFAAGQAFHIEQGHVHQFVAFVTGQFAKRVVDLLKSSLSVRDPESVQRGANHGLELLFAAFAQGFRGLVAFTDMQNHGAEQKIVKRRRYEQQQQAAVQHGLVIG